MISTTLFWVILVGYLALLNLYMIIQIIDDIEHKKEESNGLKHHFNYRFRDGLVRNMYW